LSARRPSGSIATVVWKGRHRCAATLSVDFDAETLWSGTFKLTTPSPLSRGDYDVRAALPRIHDLLDRHPDACREIAEHGPS
jgi:hypothetical protein